MNDYRFRIGWRGKLVLQRRVNYYNINTYARDYCWRDATVEDLKHYYAELYDYQTNTPNRV